MKRSLVIFTALVLLLLAGCRAPEEGGRLSQASIPRVTEAAPEPMQTLPVQTLPTQPVTEPPETEYVPPMIDTANGLREFLRQRGEEGETDFSFRFAETTVDVSPQNLARVGGYLYAHTQFEAELCHVRVTEYPGVRMVRAWRSGDVSCLSEPEQQALQLALQLVETAREGASSDFELECRLFDLFRAHVTYNDGSTAIDDPNDPPRYLTAVGALVDGSANCQGYADGFYVLASLAGFRVDRMHVDIPEGGHMVNVIFLDGVWYVVDATYNDLDDPSGTQVSYALLNVGKDKCLRYSWFEDVERYPIAEYTDFHFYYYRKDAPQRCFDSVEALAQFTVDHWRFLDGPGEYYLLLEGQIATWQELEDTLERIASGYALEVTCQIWYQHNISDTYFYIVLT